MQKRSTSLLFIKLGSYIMILIPVQKRTHFVCTVDISAHIKQQLTAAFRPLFEKDVNGHSKASLTTTQRTIHKPNRKTVIRATQHSSHGGDLQLLPLHAAACALPRPPPQRCVQVSILHFLPAGALQPKNRSMRMSNDGSLLSVLVCTSSRPFKHARCSGVRWNLSCPSMTAPLAFSKSTQYYRIHARCKRCGDGVITYPILPKYMYLVSTNAR